MSTHELVALFALQAAVTGLLALVFAGLWRTYRRMELAAWAEAWIAFLAHTGVIFADRLAERAGLPLLGPGRLALLFLHGVTIYWAMACLLAGSLGFERERLPAGWRPRFALVAVALAAVPVGLLATGLAAGWVVPLARFALRGLVATAVAVEAARHLRRRASSARPVGMSMTLAGLAAMAAGQLQMIWIGIGIAAGRWQPVAPLTVAVSDVAVSLLIGFGMVVWLLEVEQERAAAAAQAEAAARQQLEGEQQRFRAVIEQIGDLISIVDPAGRVQFRLPGSSREYFGYPTEQLAGRSVFEFIHPEDQPKAIEALRRTLETPGHTVTTELRLRHRDGRWIWTECGAINRLAVPAVNGIIVSVRDVTDRKRLEADLARAAQLESLGRLAGGVAHDFNNLLTVIRGSADLALATAEGGAVPTRELQDVESAAVRGATLVRQLLTFARKQPGDPQVVDLRVLVADLRPMLRRLLPETIELHLTQAAGPATVEADPAQLSQVVLNLVTNARDAMPSGGPLEIGVGPGELPQGPAVTLTVRDGGMGMAPEVRSRLFEPFFTTKNVGAGTGLGLAICYSIVAEAGGTIVVDSEPNRGTSVQVVLPLVVPAADGTAEGPAQPAAAPGRVLLVEDEAAVRSVVARMLARLGYSVTVADNGLSALALVTDEWRPDCLVTDVVMPVMGGVELAERLRTDWPDLPVLFMSGYLAEASRTGLRVSEPFAFLPKPYQAEDLGRAMRELRERAQAMGANA